MPLITAAKCLLVGLTGAGDPSVPGFTVADYATALQRPWQMSSGGTGCDFTAPPCPAADYDELAKGVSGPVPYLIRQVHDLDLGYRDGAGLTACNNEHSRLQGEARFLDAYVASYEASGSLYFLRKAIDHAHCVIEQRDDVRGVADYNGVSSARWRNLDFGLLGWYCWVHHSATICYPIARMANIIVNDPSLHSIPFDQTTSLLDHALDLSDRVAETIQAHESEWDPGSGTYRFSADMPMPPGEPHPGLIPPMNMLASIGLVHLHMYQVTGSPLYLSRAESLAAYMKGHLIATPDGYWWSYWPDHNPGPDNPDDLSHGGWIVAFAAAATTSGVAFSSDDMELFASTYNNVVTLSETSVCHHIDGTTECGDGTNYAPMWLVLRPWIGGQEVMRTIQAIMRDFVDVTSTLDNGLIQGLAYLARAEAWAQLKGVSDPEIATSPWAAITAIDLDGDGVDEVVMAQEDSGQLLAYRFEHETDRLVPTLLVSPGFGPASDWRGLAGIDLDDDGREELVAVRGFDGRIHTLGYLGTLPIDSLASPVPLTILGTDLSFGPQDWAGAATGRFGGNHSVVLLSEDNGTVRVVNFTLDATPQVLATFELGPGHQWADITCGDIDDDGRDEIALVQNRDGDIYLLDFDEGEMTIVDIDTIPGSGSNWTGITFANTDGNARPELLLVRGFDGLLQRYDVESGGIIGRDAMAFVGSTLSPGPLAEAHFDSEPGYTSILFLSDLTGRASVLQSRDQFHSSCLPDFDFSGDVGFADLLIVLSAWGPCGNPCPQDLDESGDVGFPDLLSLLAAWGPCD